MDILSTTSIPHTARKSSFSVVRTFASLMPQKSFVEKMGSGHPFSPTVLVSVYTIST